MSDQSICIDIKSFFIIDRASGRMDGFLTCVIRQVKLSQDELNQMQKHFHFDKKGAIVMVQEWI